MTGFQLSKWYMDGVGEGGDVVIGYAAELRWGRSSLRYGSVLVRWTGEDPRTDTAVSSSPLPERLGDTLAWTSPPLGVVGRWTALTPPSEKTFLEVRQGRVVWRCLQPRAQCEITVRGRTLVGRGYAEHVLLTIEPWFLPIDELRWGRFVGERSSLVWVDWRGKHSTQLLHLDGREVGPARIDAHSVASHDDAVRLTLEGNRVLREGAIGETVLSRVPVLRRLPLRILGVQEAKWCARGVLEDARGRDQGWAIHEVVRWPPARPGGRRIMHALGMAAYGVLFGAILPALLVVWARAAETSVRAPSWHDPVVGTVLALAGGTLIVSGWAALAWFGGGLPMNPYPPARYVSRGPYALLAHPVYTGFFAVCLGVSIAFGSASGLWLVSPTVALGCAALVFGYERHATKARFPGERPSPWLTLAPDEDRSPSFPQRISACVLAVLPWLVACAGGARAWDLGVFFLALGAPFAVPSQRALRALVRDAWLAMAVLFALPLVVPSVVPSFRVAIALLAADAWASRTSGAWAARAPWLALGLVLAAHDLSARPGLVGVATGIGAYALARSTPALWGVLRGLAERIANSWREVRIGRVRIINHGGWAALGTFGGIAIIGTLIGTEHLPAVVLAAFAALVGSALWAQLIEGSSMLLRPYGFYGGLIGICLSSLVSPWMGTPVWLLLGAYVVAGPYVQAMGRLRCLVQGCCHGRETTARIGIRYRHPRSRVCKLAHLTDVPVHATPLYSILWNAMTTVVLVRLWLVPSPLHLIGGVYLILNGLGRFVEEAYRGEPQTPVFAGLRLYQWMALASVVSGAVVTGIGQSAPAPAPSPNAASFAVGAAFGVVTWLAMGVDFPESQRRFSRLA
jgi:protein-S-isoprenylcysteine O-methyltransferase Ste14